MASNREHLHELVDRLPADQAIAAQEMLEGLLDPVSRAIASAPFDDEPESEAERLAVAEADAWSKQHPEGIPFAEVLAEYGLTMDDIKKYRLE
jgi:hypothetical protein